jgi:uncharacterized membrane protein
VASKLASKVEVGVVAAALLLKSGQLLGLLGLHQEDLLNGHRRWRWILLLSCLLLVCLMLLLSTPSTSASVFRHLEKAHTHQI